MALSIPPFAPFPGAKVRDSILPREWSLYLQSWETLAELYLRLHDREFASTMKEPGTLTGFLVSFYHELAEDSSLAQNTITLRKRCFFLLHRIWSGWDIPEELLSWTFLSDVCHASPKSERLRTLMQTTWKRSEPVIEESLQSAKTTLIKLLDSKKPEDAEHILNRLGPLLKVVPEAGVFMLTGADFLDSLSSAYTKTSPNMQKKLVTTAYLGLTALLQGQKPNYNVLSDHLYTLKTSPPQIQQSFLADLVTNTPLLSKIRDSATAPEAARVRNNAAALSAFQQSSSTRPKKIVRRKMDKGKGKVAEDDYGHAAPGEMHIHRMSLITQIQDLFPDLGSGFVVKLLDEYNDNPEEVIGHLLEDNLPPRLAEADRREQLPSTPAASKPHMSPRPTPPPSPPPASAPTYARRNVFDNDDFDRLAVSTSKLHIGRKNAHQTADTVLSDRTTAPNKSAILSALAAFDSDDDERDDTYDIEDVGGLVDSAVPDGEESDRNEEALFKAYSMDPSVFGRDAETRRGKARAGLKTETGMTDEAIEGWGIMVGREPKRLRRLEAKFNTFGGQQRALEATAYRASPADSCEESGQGQRGGRGGFGGRGRGRGRGGRGGGGGGRGGGNVAGPSDDKGTQQARQRKDASKGSRANHNRRDQRAKKMARGGAFPPAA